MDKYKPSFDKVKLTYIAQYSSSSNSPLVQCVLNNYAGKVAIFESEYHHQIFIVLNKTINELNLEQGNEYLLTFVEQISIKCNADNCINKDGECIKHIYTIE